MSFKLELVLELEETRRNGWEARSVDRGMRFGRAA